MNITAEEKLMYSVMEAVYCSDVPISFKGSMVLKACLMEAGYSGETRHTVDIDANWNSKNFPSIRQMVEVLQNAVNRCDISLKVVAFRQYCEGRSAGFEIRDAESDELLFTMDVDVNRPQPVVKFYVVDGFRFCGVTPIQMIADKVSVLSTDKVFRRIKDVVDLYYISKVFRFDKNAVLRTLKNSRRKLDSFTGFMHRTYELRHSYEKFRFEGGVIKPPFEDVYTAVKDFIQEILPLNNHRDSEE